MILAVHGTFLVYLALMLAWNVLACRRPEGRRWEQIVVLPLLLALGIVLVRDRLQPTEPPWLARPAVAALFPAAFVLALAQNVAAIRARGARLVDIPVMLCNAGLLLATLAGALELAGLALGAGATGLLYAHSVTQVLLGTGSTYAQLWTASWHLPALAPRARPATLPGYVLELVPVTVCAFLAVLLFTFHTREARLVVSSFAAEPRLEAAEPRPSLALGVWRRADHAAGEPPPGSLDAWVLPADHDGRALPTPTRPLVLALTAPEGWAWKLPPPEERAESFVAGAARLAGALRPLLLLPVPEPDGEAAVLWQMRLSPAEWAALVARAAAGARAACPATRIGVRLASTSPFSAELHALLARGGAVDVLGPRLLPGGAQLGGAGWADGILARWDEWRDSAATELWILAAGCSPLAYGRSGQAAFVEGCLARASRHEAVRALLIDGWEDRGHTLGLLDATGRPRPALGNMPRLPP